MRRFRTIVADPPWQERGGGQVKRGADRHYALLSTPSIARAMLEADVWLPAPMCHLWMWATSNHLQDALQVVDALGFRYVTHFVWVKVRLSVKGLCPQVGLGQYLRHAHELCLLATRGAAAVPPPERRPPSVLLAKRTEHSRKPDDAYRIFEQVSHGPRLEMFARREREGWTTWGNELTSTS